MFKRTMPEVSPAIVILLLASSGAAFADSLTYEAFAGVIGGPGSGPLIGNGSSGSGQNCSTSGPLSLQIGSGFSTFLPSPQGGIGPCGYFGGVIDNTGSHPQTAATGTVSATYNGNSFSATATTASGSSAAGEFALSASTASTFSGTSSSVSFSNVAAASAIDDASWTATCLSCAAGMMIDPVFNWTVSTNITTGKSASGVQGSFQISLDMQTTPSNEGEQPAFHTDARYSDTPTWTCFNNGVCPDFTAGTGSLSGTSTFTYQPYNVGVTLGTTYDEKVAWIVSGTNDETIDPDAVLTAVNWVDGSGRPVNGVVLTTSTGIYANGTYTAFASLSSAPEPGALLLCALGFLGIAAMRRRVMHR